MAEKYMLGEIEEVTATYVRARVGVSKITVPCEFPREVMDRTGIELKIGNYFNWRPSSRDTLNPGEFEPTNYPHFPELSEEEISKVADEFLRRITEEAEEEE